ncbi:MAG: hypothetical protein RL757_921 [Bacteroidota bacterium]|jgi:capsule polysaccharide export protein KpsE/RkpR
MEQRDNLLGVLATIFRYKKQIGLTVLAASVLMTVFAFVTMKDYYKSTTIFYPASPDLFLPVEVGEAAGKDRKYFGEEEDVDRMLTLANSGEVAEYLIKNFNLYQHYKIDSTERLASFKVREVFDKLYEVQKNKFNAIEISVEDTDPKTAAAMANAAREKVNEIAQRLIKESQWKQLITYEKAFSSQETAVTKVSDTLTRLRQASGVYDPEKQTEGIADIAAQAKNNLIIAKVKLKALEDNPNVPRDTIALLQAQVKGYDEALKSGTLDLEKFNTGMDKVSYFAQQLRQKRFQIALDQERYKQLKAAFEAQISALHVTDSAQVPVQKSRPKRLILLISAFLISFVLSVIAALIFDNYRKVDWQSIMAGEE